jgi:hypothetical protein
MPLFELNLLRRRKESEPDRDEVPEGGIWAMKADLLG